MTARTIVVSGHDVTMPPDCCSVGGRRTTPLFLLVDGCHAEGTSRDDSWRTGLSARAKAVFEGIGVTGVTFAPVRYRRLSPEPELWCELAVTGLAEIVRPCVGVRRGLLRPEPILLISPKVRRAVGELGLKGWRFEIVHLV